MQEAGNEYTPETYSTTELRNTYVASSSRGREDTDSHQK